MKAKDHKQLFRISSEVLDSLELTEINKTIKDMAQLDLSRAPFPVFAIECNEKFFNKMMGQLKDLQEDNSMQNQRYLPIGVYVEYLCFGKANDVEDFHYRLYYIKDGKAKNWYDELLDQNFTESQRDLYEGTFGTIARIMLSTLIVLLATRNSVKTTKEDKNLLNGKFNKTNKYRKDFPLTTTIGIGHITETMRSSGDPTRSIRPHLRRGHIRNQHYGPKNEMVKSVFIQPVFVNADEGWIAERRAYNVS